MVKSDLVQPLFIGRWRTASGSFKVLPTLGVVAVSCSLMQSAAAQQSLEEVTVTGTRIVRDGYEAPTPLTVIGIDDLQTQSSTGNVADTLNMQPVFQVSQTPEGSSRGTSAGTQGTNVLSLRGLGPTRTLTLLDGQRSVPSLLNGSVDTNNFPTQLISRVDVVTGGASAVYGSDAVAGVTNFVLDRTFTGLKSEASYGISDYGDAANYLFNVAGGFPFANDRGHILLSGEIADSDGIQPGAGNREWNRGGWGIMVNPNYTASNGQPRLLVRPEIALSNATPGGIIVSGPLRGTAFGEGGVPFQFNYGPITNDPWMQGGDWRASEIRHDRAGSLHPEVKRENVFGRASFNLTDGVTVFAQLASSKTTTHTLPWPAFQAGNGPTILSGNPFIPDTVQQRMDALGVASFRIGSMNYDLPGTENLTRRQTDRIVLGADGLFDAFNSEWTWNVYFQHGETDSRNEISGNMRRAEYAKAVDAVVGPNGTTICRVQLTNPAERCVPWNPLGTGVNGTNRGESYLAAIQYVTGTASVDENLVQKVYSASVTGQAFNTWAGPVSLAFNLEYRDEEASAKPDANSGNWFSGNFQAFDATIDVKEFAIEAVVPLAQTLDLNAAARYTDYSQAGDVTTWKVGVVFAPISQLSLRSTFSRDIRAPNFLELFTNVNSGFRSAFDPFTNTIPQFFGRNRGNPNLTPEESETFEVGLVFSPEFLPGLRASVDYWNIKVEEAIGGANDDQVLQFCFQGRTEFCNNIVRDSNGVIIELIQTPFNLASQTISGIDFEATYSMSAESLNSSWPGELSFNVRGTHYLESEVDDGLGAGPIDTLGHGGQRLNGPAEWGAIASINYKNEALRASLIARAQASQVIDNRNIVCLSSCPPRPTNGGDLIEDNSLDGYFYLDASLAYAFDIGSASRLEVFLNVRNLLNEDPGIVPQGPTDFTYVSPLSRGQTGYDLLGRMYRVGVRLRM